MALGIGIIGTGFMGKTHALAWRNVKAVLGGILEGAPTPELRMLCETPLGKAQAMADQFGFAAATDDWQALVNDPAIDVVSITTPNGLHHPMAMAAIAGAERTGRVLGRDFDLVAKEAIAVLRRFRQDVLIVREDVGRAGEFLARALVAEIDKRDWAERQGLEVPVKVEQGRPARMGGTQ